MRHDADLMLEPTDLTGVELRKGDAYGDPGDTLELPGTPGVTSIARGTGEMANGHDTAHGRLGDAYEHPGDKGGLSWEMQCL